MFRTLMCFWIVTIIACALPNARADKKVPKPEEILTSYHIDLATPALIGALSNAEPAVRENSAIVLGRRKELSAVPELRVHLGDPYIYARLAVADALLQMGDTSGISVIREVMLREMDPPAAVRAAVVLANNGKDEGLKIVGHVADTALQPMDRVQAVRALAGFRKFEKDGAYVLSEFVKLLDTDADLNVRRAAASELQNIQSAEVVQVFRRTASDQDPIIRGIAEQYLKTVQK
jgi:HEAT repeat protein